MSTSNQNIIMDEKAAIGIGTPIFCKGFQHIVLYVAGAGSANLTVKFQGGYCNPATPYDKPDFSASRSISNKWDYIEVIDYNDASKIIAGDTGLTFSGSADQRVFEFNTNAMDFICAEITAFSAGALSIHALLSEGNINRTA